MEMFKSDYANFVCDLHGHTTRSDGNDTPAEFLHHAVERKMKVVAFTDHDKTPPKFIEDIPAEEYAAKLGLTLLKGIEISCETDIEDAHFVCFGCDWDSPFFEWLDKFTMESKIESYKELVKRLGTVSMPLDWDEIIDNHGNPVAEGDVQKKMIFNMMAEKGYTKTWREAKLLVKNSSLLTIMREKPDTVDIIHEIHRQGGTIIMAHPYLVSRNVPYKGHRINRFEFIDHLIYEGLDGIEARYTYDKTSYDGDLEKEEIYRDIMERYQNRLPIISGGSDYHADGKKGIANFRDIGECGLTLSEFRSNPLLCQLAGWT